MLTFNVWDVGFAAGEFTDRRLRAICEKFKEEAAKPAGEGWDVILVQELWPWSRYGTFRQCGYSYVATINNYHNTFDSWRGELVGTLTRDGIDTGLYVLSRYPMLNSERHTYSENGRIRYVLSDGDYLANKAAMFATVLHPEAGPLQIFNTHLVSRNPQENYNIQRRGQINELASFVNQHYDGTFPAIMGGDFNFGPPPTHQAPDENFLDRVAWNEMIPRIFPLFYRVGGQEFFCTYCVSQNFFARYENPQEVDQSIDHLFISSGIEVLNSQVAMRNTFPAVVSRRELSGKKLQTFAPLMKADQSGAKYGTYLMDFNYSDHFAFEATLTLPKVANGDRAKVFSERAGRECRREARAPAFCHWNEFKKVYNGQQ